MAGASPKQRLSLVERQKNLVEQQRLAGAARTQPPTVVRSASAAAALALGARPKLLQPTGFQERQDALLAKTGRGNATRASRSAVPLGEGVEGEADDGASTADTIASRFSRAPSVHPSLAGSVCSLACSEATIGAGDDTGYWDFQHRVVGTKDLGQKCRECKQPFKTLGEPLTERRGARISMRYHAECFSGFADPRSQSRSSHHEGHLAGHQLEAAPANKAGSKMRCSTHFDSGRVAAGVGGKFGSQMGLGHNGFGSKSSKGQPAPEPKRRPGGFTVAQLAEHNRQQQGLASITEAEGGDAQ